MTQVAQESTRYKRSDRVDETRVGDRVVLFQRDTGSGVVLNPTGSLIWDSLVAPQSPADLARVLATKFPSASADQIEADVFTYLGSLVEQSLIAGDT